MELKGKYLTATIRDESARVFFDLPGTGVASGKQWTFTGEIEGETPGLGVWVRIDSVMTPDGMMMSAPGPYTTLLRWDWIVKAFVTSERPSDPGAPGFRLSAEEREEPPARKPRK